MKWLISFVTFLFCCQLNLSYGQDSTYLNKKVLVHTVEKNVIQGLVIADDGREITLQSPDIGKVIISKDKIVRIEIQDTEYFNPSRMASIQDYSYFTALTTNSLPFNRETIIIRSPLLFSWMADVSMNKKISMTFGTFFFYAYFVSGHFRLSNDDEGGLSFSTTIGTIAGTRNPNSAEESSAFLGRVCYTIGTKKSNISIGGGYGSLFTFRDNAYYFSVTGMKTILHGRGYLMFESFTAPAQKANATNLIFRMPTKRQNAFDFGLTVLSAIYPYPPKQEYRVFALPHLGLNVKF
jgi:hypothetical protein